MHAYAQTNIQLFNQLRADGYSERDRAFLFETYEFAMRIFTGLYMASGKPFIDHLVGTASILASLHAPVEVLAAGLIHAAYLYGDFGCVRKGMTNAKRDQVRRAVGERIENYIARYDRRPINLKSLTALRDRLDDLDAIDRTVLLMRLANELEHHLDLGSLYFPSEKQQRGHRRYLESYGPLVVTLAERLGFPSLAAELKIAFGKIAAVEPPLEPCVRVSHTDAFLNPPRSYRQCFSAVSWRHLCGAYRSSSSFVRIAKRLGGRLWRFIHDQVRPQHP
jgi:(p)ppGpp synthase/HD superfamily hydrolase